MSSYGRLVVSFDGHTEINDGTTYSAIFIDGNSLDVVRSTPIEASRVGNTPLHVRVQPDGLSFTLLIEIEGGLSQAKLDQLKAWFNPKRGERWLVATDEYGEGVDERIKCAVTGFTSQNTTFFMVELRAAEGAWQQVTDETDSQDVGEGVDETLAWTLANEGTDDTPMVVTVTASAAKDDADSYTKRRWLSIANLSEDELDDQESDGYPVMVADLTALSITPGDHVRVFNGALELRRWIDASDRVWVNLHMRPRKVATLAANIDDNDTALTVDNPEGFDNDSWYDNGFFKIDDETIQYTGRGTYDAGVLVRGARGSTPASHTAGATLYWVEHDYLYLLYDFDTPPDPPLADDYEPLIDMDNSSNEEHQWADEFYNEIGSHRSRGWQRRSTDQGDADEHIRQYAGASVGTFENDLPEAGKPALNDAVMRFPVPLAGPLELDLDIGLEMLIRAFVQDSEGYETRLFRQLYTPTPLTGDSHALAGNVRQLRLNGSLSAILGDIDEADPDVTTETVASPDIAYFRFELDEPSSVYGVIAHHAKSGGGLNQVSIWPNKVSEEGFDVPDLDQGHVPLNATLPDTTPGWVIYQLSLASSSQIFLDAGIYHLLIPDGTIFSRRSPRILQRSLITYVDNTDPENPGYSPHIEKNGIFALLSLETAPQFDAPFDAGGVIEFSNVVAPLDDTRSPKVDVGSEDDVYLLEETLTNDTSGEFIDLFFPLSINEGIEIDTGQRLITDLETGQLVPWARQASSRRWPHLVRGDNDMLWDGVGVTGLSVETSYKPLRL